jgi:predicted ATP-grasp superfamily ATP-dependent carboligase
MIHDNAELLGLYSALAKLEPRCLIQDYVEGDNEQIYACGMYISRTGALINSFCARKILIYPDRCGTGIIFEACIMPEITELSASLAHQLGITGCILEVEFKRDSKDKEYTLIEANPRHFDEHRLGAAVGVNLSVSLYNDYCTGQCPQQTQDRSSVRWIAEQDVILEWFRSMRGDFKTLRTIVETMLFKQKVFNSFDSRDLRPACKLLANTAASLWAIAFSKRRKNTIDWPAAVR